MLSRRSVIAGGVATLAGSAIVTRAQTSPAEGPGGAAAPTILRLERRGIEVNGKAASVFGIRQPGGAFGLVTDVGKPFRVRVENGVDQPSLIHWHGLTPPWRQDGVPGISGPPISPGESGVDYDFTLRFGGARSGCTPILGLQEQLLMGVCTAHHPR